MPVQVPKKAVSTRHQLGSMPPAGSIDSSRRSAGVRCAGGQGYQDVVLVQVPEMCARHQLGTGKELQSALWHCDYACQTQFVMVCPSTYCKGHVSHSDSCSCNCVPSDDGCAPCRQNWLTLVEQFLSCAVDVKNILDCLPSFQRSPPR